MKTLLTMAFVAFATPALAGAPAAKSNAHAKDEAELTKILAEFDTAWNTGDAKGRTKYAADDISIINPMGEAAWGKAAVEALFARETAGFAKGTQHKITPEQWTWLGNDTVFADCSATVTGAKNPDGTPANWPPFHAVIVFQKRAGAWKWVAARPYAYLPPPAHAATN